MAQDINSVFVIGRLTKDPEVKYTTGGTAKMEISIAVNRSVKEGDSWVLRPSYFDVEYWGKRAESINQYLHKGKQIGISGYLDQKRWTGQDGTNHSRIVIVADRDSFRYRTVCLAPEFYIIKFLFCLRFCRFALQFDVCIYKTRHNTSAHDIYPFLSILHS